MIKSAKKIILTVFVLTLCNVQASVLTAQQVYDAVNKKIYAETKQKLSNISDDFEIKITGIPAEDYKTNDLNPLKIELASQNSTFTPNSFKRVIIKDSKNNIVKAFPINIQTFVYKNVLVANNIIPYNQELKAQNVSTERKEISKYLGKTFSAYQSGLVTSRNFQKGSIILSDYVKPKSVVSKNSIVEIIFLSDKGLRITLQGKALKDGGIGDTIPVRSDKYNKVYNAKISSSNEVMVRI